MTTVPTRAQALPRALRMSLASIACLAVCALSACSAKVNDFVATPRHVCAGDRVALRWSVVGSATLHATPAVAGAPEGSVADEGSATLAPSTTSRIDLHVTRFLGSATTSTQEIEVRAPAAAPEPLTVSLADADGAPGCRDGKVWATVHAKRFAAGVKVARISTHPGDDRPYDVDHAGAHATVAPGDASTAFQGAPIAGDWILTSPLRPGEACGTPTLPRSLVIDVFTQCNPESTP